MNDKAEYTEEKWREHCKKNRSGLVMSPQWLRNGCPHCDCKNWQVTADGWAYCDNCRVGMPTDYPFTFAIIAKL